MSKKKDRKQQPKENPVVAPTELRKLKLTLTIFIALLAVILYANTFSHDYTLDDHPAIDENKVTVLGIAGIPTLLATDYWYGYKDELRGPVYRPTSLILFAVVWQFFPNNPHVYHLMNILFYALTCTILFLMLCRLFKNYNIVFPFVCALLYTAHPIHTEVVDNIKSMDEILCFLFAISSLFFFLKYISNKSKAQFVAGCVCFFLSLISKETGITFLAIIPLAIYYFQDGPFKKHIPVLAGLVTITGIYLLLRLIILKDINQGTGITANVLNNTLNAAPDVASRYATVFYVLLRYVGLLVFPHPLTVDYNFSQIKIQSFTDMGALMGLLFFIGLGILSILKLTKKNILIFGFLFFVIALAPVSNFFFIGGSTMAERFLYIPSLGFCIALAYFIFYLTKSEKIKNEFKKFSQLLSKNATLFLLVFGMVVLYSVKTIGRNKYWANNLTIFAHDIEVSENSATAHKILGTSLFEAVKDSPDNMAQADTFRLAKYHLLRALEIYPSYPAIYGPLGVIYYLENKFDSAYYFQKKELETNKDDIDLNNNYAKTLNKLLRYDEAIVVSNRLLTLSPNYESAYFNLALAYTNKRDLEKGFFYFSKLIEINPARADAYYYAGMILKANGDEVRANEFLKKAASLGYRAN